MKLRPLLPLAAALLLLGGCPGGGASGGPTTTRFRTGRAERGEVVEGVQASGTVQPVLLVQVGTQVSGVIEKLFADFNSQVKAGQTIAVLDTRRLAAQVAEDEASVARAAADLERLKAALDAARSEVERVRAAGSQAAAEVDRARALLTQAERELERQRTLAEQRLVSASDLDAAVANRASLASQLASAEASVRLNAAQLVAAAASVRQGEAQIAVGEAAVLQAKAQLDGDRVNLDYATIVSPVDGVVVSRNVDVGQTVAASLSAPTLFVIANDLTKVQVQTSVPEADIGRLHEGQGVRFTVDAHPDKAFAGSVSQVRLASTTVQNVVTYTVVVDAANDDGLLLPGMTANVQFEIRKSPRDALSVPTSALRLAAPPELLETPPAPGAPDEGGRGGPGASEAGRPPGRADDARGTVYLPTPAGKLRSVAVRTGISDGVRTVVEPLEAGALADGAEVVTAVIREEAATTTNPFAPPRMGGPRSSTSASPGGAR